MPITLRDFLNFPFNGGRGIRADQIADVDVPVLARNVDDIMSGRLGYTWRYAILFRSQSPSEADLVHQMHSASSEFPELTTPEFTQEDTYFGAVAIPLAAPEAYVNAERSLSANILDRGSRYRRLQDPVYVNGVPHRVYVSRYYLRPSWESGAQLTLVPRLRFSRYARYAISSVSSGHPAFSDSWTRSNSPVLTLDGFAGQARHVHIAIPHGTVTPTRISLAAHGADNLAGAFTRAGSLLMIDGVPYAVYSSDNRLAAAAYSGRSIVVLPERADIPYYEAPTVLADAAVGFTWYAGFYDWPSSGRQPTNPVTAALINAGTGVSSSSTAQIVMPDDGDGDPYQPDANRHYVRFLAQPSTAAAIDGLYSVPLITYDSLEAKQARATQWWTTSWNRQADDVVVNGVTYNVWLNRQTVSFWYSNPRSGERFHAFRS